MRKIEPLFQKIMEKAEAGTPLEREDCHYLLSLDEKSFEAGLLRVTAAEVLRRKNENSAIILGQIGVEILPCPGRCQFCTFGEKHTHVEKKKMPLDDLKKKIEEFCEYGDLYGLYLMTMHEYDRDHFLECARLARKIAPPTTKIWANVGDTSLEGYREMRAAGVSGIYHVCRLREGTDTELKPEDRIQSMNNALQSGLELFSCCEPVGPEHTVDELVDSIFLGVEMEITQHAAMRRVAVPGTPLAHFGQISELRLAQITAVTALASVTVPTMTYMGMHEPNELCMTAGANIITAESGANPRDISEDTSHNRGMDMARCRKMLFECGFDYIRRGDESKIPLNYEYLVKTNSWS